ncbi:uncharacterized protein [Macrobrachium rosenbergii]|uniref:uncharacterized protein n=1 Tax=Macrobrachium rosenbergii TaxID=79674 RepID=UPI0034D5557B
MAWKITNKEAKGAVARAKAEGINEMYEKVEASEGEKMTYNIAKRRDRATEDLTQIKDRKGRVLSREEWIRARWKEDFEKLSNEENPRRIREEGNPRVRAVLGITEKK